MKNGSNGLEYYISTPETYGIGILEEASRELRSAEDEQWQKCNNSPDKENAERYYKAYITTKIARIATECSLQLARDGVLDQEKISALKREFEVLDKSL